jgi:Holliday junction resolvase RusA-like endonuclease
MKKKITLREKLSLNDLPIERNKYNKDRGTSEKIFERGRLAATPRGAKTVLEDAFGYTNCLLTVSTRSSNRENQKREIRKTLTLWLDNPRFEEVRKKDLDLSIVVLINPLRMKTQDVDNIAKPIMDALKRNINHPNDPYLFEEDSQIRRLLIEKIQKVEHNDFDTDDVYISFREYDPQNQMIMKPLEII